MFFDVQIEKEDFSRGLPHKRSAEDRSEESPLLNLMMEKPDSRKCHSHTVLIACLDDVVVTD